MNTYDIETFIEKGKVIPYCVCFYFKKKYMYTYGENCILDSIYYIFSFNFTKKNIFIHNLNFDGFLIIECLSKTDLNFDVFSNNLNLYSIKIKYLNKIIIFKCSYKILPISLNKISEIFNLENKMSFPYKYINKNNIYSITEIPNCSYFNSKEDYENFIKYNKILDIKNYSIKYCMNDVKITYSFLNNLKNIIKVFKINIENVNSSPSLALEIFNKRFNHNKIKLSHNNLIDKFARKSYFGGRCEVYGNPFEDDYIFHYDFTGMYAQCMLEKFPYGKHYIDINTKDFTKPGIYWIEYTSIDMYRPILPHHREKDKKLLFCNGKMKGSFWYEEIQLFIENGGIVNKILYSLTFEKYEEVFNEYVDFFTNLRKKSKEYNIFGKLMINSIYGRLGMSDINEYSFILNKEKFESINKKIDIVSYKELNEIYLIQAEMNNKLKKVLNINKTKTKNNIVIASAITSKARIKLWKAQKSVEDNNGRVLYSDTDSIFASYKKDVSNETHGEVFWDISKKDTKIKDAIFFSPKSYALKYDNDEFIIKIKGYTEKSINFDEIKKIYFEKKNIELKNYKFLNKKDLKLSYIETIKNFDLNYYDKRIFINKKKETIPFYYENFEYKIKY